MNRTNTMPKPRSQKPILRVPERMDPTHITITKEGLPINGPVTDNNPAFTSLVVKVKNKGCLNPIFVRKNGLGVELVEGYYRLMAAIKANRDTVLVVYVSSLKECNLSEVGPEYKYKQGI